MQLPDFEPESNPEETRKLPPTVQLDGLDPMIMLEHLGEGWSLLTRGLNYDNPDSYHFYVKKGERSRNVPLVATALDISYENGIEVAIKDGLQEDGRYQINTTLPGMTTATLREGGDVLFASQDGKVASLFANPQKQAAAQESQVLSEL